MDSTPPDPARPRPPALDVPRLPLEARLERGRAARKAVPRARLADPPPHERADPIARLVAGNAGRDPALVPLRMARMASSPFGFLRGSAAVMAADLAAAPVSGFDAWIDGDAHLANFGLFGTPDGRVVYDLNDFDETTVGPWEWDLKRLAASVEVAGREIGLDVGQRSHAVRGAAGGYRTTMRALAPLPVLALWQRRTTVEDLFADVPAAYAPEHGVQALIAQAHAKALASDNAALLRRMARRDDADGWRFVAQPPLLTLPEPQVRERVAAALAGYLHTLSPERRFMVERYRIADVAHRVVGVGSVGLRAWCAMLFGADDDDPLFLQVKQATEPAHAPWAPALPDELAHHGRRVVYGQRLLQAAGDPLVGWATIDGLPYYVRQMRNLKASFAPEKMSAPTFAAFAWIDGELLARAHARTADAAAIAGWCGRGDEIDGALVEWARAYAGITEADHARLVDAIARGEVEAARGVDGGD